MFSIPGGLAERLGFPSFNINLDLDDIADVSEEAAAHVSVNPRFARRR
ncbi:MAG: hypothetical protein UY00_C0061G0011 [Candidatus Wolfebacteria bacterium GW2011_GWA1_47_6]|nr:MAG: hypothetical protein UY00_C0061G0011 [Candidatus Wolfebacteria bacterium GW2011_GWA1_47_6]